MLQVFQRGVLIAAHGRLLEGDLSVPERTSGIVIFAHGSGGSRRGPRTLHVVGALNQKGLATLTLDLLTTQEEMAERWGRELTSDIDMLASRLLAARDWLLRDRELQYLPVGYFGTSIGAAAALVAAARQPVGIAALVGRSARPDLVPDVLPLVTAPTLFIVAGEDVDNLLLNQKALDALRAEKSLRLVPHATASFEEPGALDEVARLAGDWLSHHFGTATRMRAYGWADEQGRWV